MEIVLYIWKTFLWRKELTAHLKGNIKLPWARWVTSLMDYFFYIPPGSGERFAMPLALGCLCQRQLASDRSGRRGSEQIHKCWNPLYPKWKVDGVPATSYFSHFGLASHPISPWWKKLCQDLKLVQDLAEAVQRQVWCDWEDQNLCIQKGLLRGFIWIHGLPLS